MPFQRPTLTEIIDRIIADMESRLVGVPGAVLRRSLAGIIARTEGGAVHLLYGYLDWIAEQVMPDTAESEYLDRWARIWLPGGRKVATFSFGGVTFTGQNGFAIPAGTVLQRQDGAQFITTEQGIIAGGSSMVRAEAITAGATGNMLEGTTLVLESPINGVANNATVYAGGFTGGTDTESDQRLRERLLQRIQQPPQGGAASDYVTWALEVPGVTRAWCFPLAAGPGTVLVLFTVDDDPNGPLPDPAKIQQVREHIEVRRPVTAMVYVTAPGVLQVDVTAQVWPDTPAVRAAVKAELEDLFRSVSAPGSVIFISKIREAVSIASGEENSIVHAPTSDVTPDTGELPVLGDVTFVEVP